MTTVLLVDGHSLAYRAFHALPVAGFTTSSGQPTNAVFGFTSMLLNVVRDERPDYLCVAFDVSRQTFRSEMYPAYKATRAATPPEFRGQVSLIEEVLDALGVARVSAPGYEADDVIATLATHAEQAGHRVLILTGDRDALQLVDDDVTVLYARRGVSDLARMTPDAVVARYGVPPQWYADLAALRGDPSDNLPSVPGVGEKTAARWIVDHGGLAPLLAHAGELPGKSGAALRERIADVQRNRELIGLVRDVPLPVTVEQCAMHPVPAAAVQEVFDALEFRVLRERLAREHGDWVTALAPVVEGVHTVDSPGADAVTISRRHGLPPAEVGQWCARFAGVTTGVALARSAAGAIRGIAIAAPGAGPDDAITLPGTDLGVIAAWLADPTAGKAMHDAKPDLRALAAAGTPLAGLTADTAVAAYLLLPGQVQYTRESLVERFLGLSLPSPVDRGEGPGQLDLGALDEAQIEAPLEPAEAELLALAAAGTRRLAEILAEQLAARGGTELLTRIEVPLVGVLAEMESTGIAVDDDALARLAGEFAGQCAELADLAEQQAGRPFNLGSPKQLQQVLFVERGLPRTKRTKTGFTTDAEALTDLFTRTADPLLATILQWRDVSRLGQTVAGLRPLIGADGRVHTTFNQMVSATGRLSSMDPNLQNIPVRTAAGRRIRAAFIAGADYEALLTADYSQIELRIMAHLSGDAGLIAALTGGEDLHVTMAGLVFGVPSADVGPELRSRVKAVSYGLAYGLSPFGLSSQLGVSVPEARALTDAYFDRFGGVRDYLARVVEQARQDGYTETLFGRRRYLPDLVSDNRQRRDTAERMALNAPIQGSAADIVKIAMIGLAEDLRTAKLSSRLLLQVHDELVVEVFPGEAAEVSTLVRQRMTTAVSLSVPLEVSIGIGPTWDAAAH